MSSPTTASVLIVGKMPCCICGEMMSQQDVSNQEAILSTSERQMPFVGIIAHVSHFYVLVNNTVTGRAPNYLLNTLKFALAVGRDRGDLQPDAEARMVAQIKKAELEFNKGKK